MFSLAASGSHEDVCEITCQFILVFFFPLLLCPVFRTSRSRAPIAAVWTGSPSAPTRTWTATGHAVHPSPLRTSPPRTTCGLNSTRTTRSPARASGSLTSQVVQRINTAIYKQTWTVQALKRSVRSNCLLTGTRLISVE